MKRKTLSFVLAALLVLPTSAPPAFADPLNQAFCKGQESPKALAVLVKQSLAIDPSGMTRLDPNACHMPRPARPLDYQKMFEKDDPDAPKDVRGLVDYLDSLIIQEAPPGKYWMACIKPNGTPLHDCLPREARKGEKFWVTPIKKRLALAQTCTNPIGRPEHPDNCVYHEIAVREGDEVNIGQAGPTDLSLETVCTPLIKRPGESEFESPKVQECPDLGRVCAWQGFNVWWTGSVKVHAGVLVFRGPRKLLDAKQDYRMLYCITRAEDGAKADLGIQWYDHTPAKGDALVPKGAPLAIIYYTGTEGAKLAKTSNGVPSVLWWHFTS